ncbi:PTS sugar transporter subunit IIC [Enterococcus sp. 669A]|uniref:PTS sugar transporter subunit IIC n=1 Tax=Candidatus Enterococcus moelleringii TaxID=2815325 RepID=A0ABS3L9H9_9ENTE|nr:PTS sugar transporter subunit IIC [Enterococcus sp. 669A]MBO1306281.1 PTS sugar transporter subunit IIC [Enterococcus sp. 669A]
MDARTVILAAAMAFLYWFGKSYIGYSAAPIVGAPFIMGLVAGIIHGDVQQGIMISGSIMLIYLGVISPGGQLPSDSALAAACVLPIALNTGISTEVAVTLAVPLGILGAFLYNSKKILNVWFVERADKRVEEADIKGLWRYATLYPLLLGIPVFFLPVFLVGLFGQDIVQPVLNAIPEWLMHGLEAAGGMLPAIGFAMILYMLGRAKYIPFFIIGFYMVQILEVSTLVSAIIAASVAFLVVVLRREFKEDLQNE